MVRVYLVAVVSSVLGPVSAVAEFRIPECSAIEGLPLNSLPAAIENGAGDDILEPVFGVRAAQLTAEMVEATKQASRDCRLPVTLSEGYLDRAWEKVLVAALQARERDAPRARSRPSRSRERRAIDRHSAPLADRMRFLRVAEVRVRERHSFRPADLMLMESSIRSYIADRRVVEHVVQASWVEAQKGLDEAWPAFGRALCANVREAAIRLFREDAGRTAPNPFIE